MRRSAGLVAFAAASMIGCVAVGVWLWHDATVWSRLTSSGGGEIDMHDAALRRVSLLVAVISLVAAVLAFAGLRRATIATGVLLLVAAVLVIVGLQLSPAHMWLGAMHLQSTLRYSHRFRQAAVVEFVAATCCAVAVAMSVAPRRPRGQSSGSRG